ncbi:YqaE/Pmp3 family membrane protein [Flavobacterium sp. 22076]|uniref:YqaE/Pmp3 family membrane protein n=1 Tax=unclassified Flavobacterium TaxID=196869 RepID=UPI003F83CEBA
MMTLIAIFFPSLSFLLRGKVLTALLCLILQITLIGWIPAAIWAVLSLQNSRAEKRNAKLIRAVRSK